MLRALALQEITKACFTQRWLAFLLGRPPGEPTERLAEYVLEPGNGCVGAEVGPGTPCVGDVTVVDAVHAAAACAQDAVGDLHLRELSVAVATTPLLIDGAFPCGGQRCLEGFEWCSISGVATPGGTDSTVEMQCLPYGPGEAGCELAAARASDCTCTVVDEGATVSCQD